MGFDGDDARGRNRMMWQLVFANAQRIARSRSARLFSGRANFNALEKQAGAIGTMTKAKWTEEDVLALPIDEDETFERKSGAVLSNSDFQDVLAKALSAFANSGGGSFVIGVANDRTIDGVPSAKGRTPIKDWFEQTIPNLLDYPLSDFKVHVVERDNASQIPAGREVIVIDIGDSPLAPHQSKRDRTYYQRVGSHSRPAPHFYLELLRQRLTEPVLQLKLRQVDLRDAYEFDGGLFVALKLEFGIDNVGRIAAYQWNLVLQSVEIPEGRDNDVYIGRRSFPKALPGPDGVRMDNTILPGIWLEEGRDMGLLLRPLQRTPEAVTEELRTWIDPMVLHCRIATELSRGENLKIGVAEAFNIDALVAKIHKHCLSFFNV